MGHRGKSAERRVFFMYGSEEIRGILIGTLMMLAAWNVVFLIAMGKLLSKTGRCGALVLVPGYGRYLVYKAADSAALFWVSAVCGTVSAIFQSNIVIGVLMTIVSLIVYVMFNIRLAHAFGKGNGFAWGMILLPGIFHMVLAFGSSSYEGGQADDAVLLSDAWICSCGAVNKIWRNTCGNCNAVKPAQK